MLMTKPSEVKPIAEVLSPLDRAEIERKAAEIEKKLGAYYAEIVPDETPHWHLVRTAPSQENLAVKHLSARGIGVYLPMSCRQIVRRKRQCLHRALIFPGYVFAFVWDVERHWRRIKACPGVQTVVCINEKPIVVPDVMIERILVTEALDDVRVMGEQRPRRRRKTGVIEDASRVDISTKSYWREITDSDPARRNSALHRALGLAA
jgi:transcription antitermination factor NusG